MLAHLPEEVQPIVTFAYITGCRITSEVLPLQWRQVDFKSAEVRLDAGMTKNTEGRVFIMTDDLRTLLETQQAEHERLKEGRAHLPVRVLPSSGRQAWRRRPLGFE